MSWDIALVGCCWCWPFESCSNYSTVLQLGVLLLGKFPHVPRFATAEGNVYGHRCRAYLRLMRGNDACTLRQVLTRGLVVRLQCSTLSRKKRGEGGKGYWNREKMHYITGRSIR